MFVKLATKTKKILVLTIISAVVLAVLTTAVVYWNNHPTHYLFNDKWIIGKSVYEIEHRYGGFDKHFSKINGGFSKGYCVKERSLTFWGDYSLPEYYMIHFDDNGIAYKVIVEEGGWGG